MENSVRGDASFGVVRSKRTGLTDRDGTEDESREDSEDILEFLVGHVVWGDDDLIGSEAEDGGIHEEDGGLGEGVGEAVYKGVHQPTPRER